MFINDAEQQIYQQILEPLETHLNSKSETIELSTHINRFFYNNVKHSIDDFVLDTL